MNKTLSHSFRHVTLIATLLACVSGAHASTSMQIIADNDFAVFAGSNTSITSLVYQNNVGWPDQLIDSSTFTFDLLPGQTTIYLLGMGGGVVENISGTMNGVDLVGIPVSMSSDLGSYLTGYQAEANGGTVADGSYDAMLTDVQAALSHLTWGNTTPTDDGDYVAQQSPTGHGFHFDPSTAHLFRFTAADVEIVTPTPEPSTCLLFGAGAVAVALSRRRRSSAGR